MKKITSIPNATRTFDALRSLGYDLNSSIADLIDNSLAKQVAASEISILLKINKTGSKLRLIDNGNGMSDAQLVEAMRLGSESVYDEGDLGKFGMGMKTASLSHCNVLTVISKRKNTKIVGYRWDLNHLKKHDAGWVLFQLTDTDITSFLKQEKLTISTQGTIVCWDDLFIVNEEFKSQTTEKLKLNYVYRIEDKLRLHIGMVFHRFIQNRRIIIKFNSALVKPWDPFCLKEKTEVIKLTKEASNFVIAGYKKAIAIKGYVLPDKSNFSSEAAWKEAKGLLSWNDAQGYYIYRADRIIRFGGWQNTKAKDEHDKLARVSIDIHNEIDHLFRLNVNKTLIQFPDQLYNHLKNIVNPIVIKKAQSSYRKEGKKTPFQNTFRRKEHTLTEISKNILAENGIKTRGKQNNIEVQNGSGGWISNKISDFIKYGPNKDFEIVSAPIKEGHVWKVVCNSDQKIKIIINNSHTFYKRFYNSSNKIITNAIDALVYSLAISELNSRSQSTAHLFDSFKSDCSDTLTKIIKEEVL